MTLPSVRLSLSPLPGSNPLSQALPGGPKGLMAGVMGMPDSQLSQALSKAANPMVIIDRLAAVKWCNPAYSDLVGKSISSMIGQKPFCLSSSKENQKFFIDLWDMVMKGKIWKGELLERGKAGETIHVDAVMTPLDDVHGRPALFMLFLHDITERKMEYDDLWQQANFDRLTGLANRGFFLSMLDHFISVSLRNQTRLAVLFMDLDGFKAVNDTFGHLVGDELLVEAGQVIKNNVRRSDLVARLGGDEFCCMLNEIDNVESAGLVAQKIISSMGLLNNVKGCKVKVGVSIGISMYPDHGFSQKDLLKNADSALYEAKRSGKNCWKVFSGE